MHDKSGKERRRPCVRCEKGEAVIRDGIGRPGVKTFLGSQAREPSRGVRRRQCRWRTADPGAIGAMIRLGFGGHGRAGVALFLDAGVMRADRGTDDGDRSRCTPDERRSHSAQHGDDEAQPDYGISAHDQETYFTETNYIASRSYESALMAVIRHRQAGPVSRESERESPFLFRPFQPR